MKIKKPQEYVEMLQEITDNFSEYLEEGCDPSGYILSLLHKEREENFYLKMKVDYLERKLHENI
jgi:hypothetical protein